MINTVLTDVAEIAGKGLIEISDTYVIRCCKGRT
jgi:hypothetical protein